MTFEAAALAYPVLSTLERACSDQGLQARSAGLGRALEELGRDLVDVDETLNRLRARRDPVTESAQHLLSLPGKRLRPICVALAARVGTGFSTEAQHLATAVELVHAATLLHDDVVDLGVTRRGQPTARLIYGNAASIFAGDWLLVEALRHVARANLPGVLDTLLGVIGEMIEAEAIQLEARGRIVSDRSTYFAVVRGKTASLFRFAFHAGARAGGVDPHHVAALERFGENLGIAFQIVDDVLDLSGDEESTGKSLFADLSEGKMTFPSIIGMERDPSLAALLRVAATGFELPLAGDIVASLEETGACAEAMRIAEEHVGRAADQLSLIPASESRDLLELVARATTARRR